MTVKIRYNSARELYDDIVAVLDMRTGSNLSKSSTIQGLMKLYGLHECSLALRETAPASLEYAWRRIRSLTPYTSPGWRDNAYQAEWNDFCRKAQMERSNTVAVPVVPSTSTSTFYPSRKTVVATRPMHVVATPVPGVKTDG